MRYAKWLDHAPPWVSWGTLFASGVFTVAELVYMTLPLLLATLVEVLQLQLYRWRRLIELACLSVLVIGRVAKMGWVLTFVLLLFALCGARLSLPRSHETRLQVIFMAFLLFLLTTVANTSLSFLPWTLIWTAIASLALYQLNIEKNLLYKNNSNTSAPIARVAKWTMAATLLGVVIFLILPRPSVGWRPLPFGINGLTSSYTGLADRLSLDGGNPIQGNSDVVARILPPQEFSESQRRTLGSRMSLLVGIRLESASDGKWEMLRQTPSRQNISFATGDFSEEWIERLDTVECFVYPSPTGIIPTPYGGLQVFPPRNMRMQLTPAGAIRWSYPLARAMPFRFRFVSHKAETIDDRQIRRRGLKIADPATIEALNWSLRIAPRGLHPNDLVDMLVRELKTYRYTLDNPSGKARDSLSDFLTRTKAGHCEYFAHALASALRHRGIASRVVNGYRLGAWIPEGGYWLITQNDAHSWVEYVDPETNIWVPVDPTPPRLLMVSWRWQLSEKIGHVLDAMRFRWDRYVVRFSDAEQQKGIAWISSRWEKTKNIFPKPKTIYTFLGVIALLGLAFVAWRKRQIIHLFFHPHIPIGTVLAIHPLIRSTRLQPEHGETLRKWFVRLYKLRPDRKTNLEYLADLIESRVYGESDVDIVQPIKAEAREWRKKKTTTIRNSL